MNAIQTKHNLDFEAAPSPYDVFGDNHQMFRVGTCEGQWGFTKDCLFILSVLNKEQGNGHLDDVFEWFEFSAKRQGMNLMVLECMNQRFYDHLIKKRGFQPLDAKQTNCIKVFNRRKFKQLIKNGNEIINKETLTCI